MRPWLSKPNDAARAAILANTAAQEAPSLVLSTPLNYL
jgi:hypothetical protein